MAFRFMESFDAYSMSEITKKWDLADVDLQVGTGRFGGGQSLRVQGNRSNGTKIIDAQTEWIVGFAFYNSGGSSDSIMRWRSGGSGGSVIDDLYFDAGTQKLTVRRGGSTNLGTTTIPLPVSTWMHVGWRLVINGTTGIVQVWINGILDINLSSQNTGSGTADTFQMGGGGAGVVCYVDDIYILDGTGSAPTNAFLGDLRIQALYPSGNGNSSQLVGSDGNSTDNYLLVDEALGSDSDYVESSTVGNKDTYAYGDLAASSGTVYAVQPCVRAWKTDAGVRSIASIARTSGTEVDSANKTLTGTSIYHLDVRETKPGGGSWSVSDVNASEFGVKITA